MTYIKLFAGLGNQLFQFAYGRYLASRGERVRYLASPSPGGLNAIFDLDGIDLIETANRWYSGIIKVWAKYGLRAYKTGFFQEARFAAIAKTDFTFTFRRQRAYEASNHAVRIMSSNAVSIHIRGGDYLAEKSAKAYGGLCTPEYYRSSLQHLSDRIGGAPEIFLFSDDPAYAASMLRGLPYDHRLVHDEIFRDDPGFDLFLMSRCRHHIIANSTFSWWGAFLGASDGITIIPSSWSNDASTPDDGLYPAGWIRISADGQKLLETQASV